MKMSMNQVLNSCGHYVKCRNLTFVGKQKICAIVKLCQQIGDTQIHTKILNNRIMNRSSGHLFSACVIMSKMENMRSQTGKSMDDRGN
jgi:hypothetical protein